jgi:hypothetical protein
MTPVRPLPRRAALLAIALLGWAVRLYALGSGSLWYDETVSAYLASLDLPAMVAHTAGDIHPPLYYGLLHIWTLAGGRSEFSLAFFSLVFGILLIAATQRVARAVAGPTAGWIAALLAAVSPFGLWYSQEVRMYTLGSLLALASTWLMLRLLQRDPAGARPPALAAWWGFVIATAAGLYSLYYFAFLIVAQNIIVAAWALAGPGSLRLRLSGNTAALRLWLAAQAAVLVAFLPWLPVALRQATQPPVPPWRGAVEPWQAAADSFTALALGQSADAGVWWPVLLLIAVLYLLGLRAVLRGGATPGGADRPSAVALALAGHTWLPLALILTVSLVVPLFHVRYVFAYAAPFCVVVAAGLQTVARWRRSAAALALAAIVIASGASTVAYFTQPAFAADDHRGATQYISDHWRPGDAVLINAGYVYPAFLYYYDGAIAWRGRLSDFQPTSSLPGATVLQTGSIGDGGPSQLGWGDPRSDFYPTTAAETLTALDRVAGSFQRLWVYRCYDTVTDPDGDIRRYLDQRYAKLDDVGFAGSSFMRVQLYQTSPAASTLPAGAIPLSGPDEFAAKVRLLAYFLQSEARAGEPLYLNLYWQAQRTLTANLKAFVVLRDEYGVVAQWDTQPVAPLAPSTGWAPGAVQYDPWRLDLPVGIPPGRYRLTAGLYDPANGQRLWLLARNGQLGGDEAALAEVTLAREALPADTRLIGPAQRGDANFGDLVDLLGYTVGASSLAPGRSLDITVFWRARRDLTGDLTVFVQLLDAGNKPWAATDARPWQGRYPTTRWLAGEVVRDTYSLTLAPDAPDGEYRLIIGLYRTDDRARLPVTGFLRGGDSVTLATLPSIGSPRTYLAPPMQHALGYRLGEAIQLLGYDSEPGQSVTLYWKCLQPVATSYNVFFHVLDSDGRLLVQNDSLPAAGLSPTNGWLPGQIITDPHPLGFDPPGSMPAGYRVAVGLYELVSGQRLPVTTSAGTPAGDSITLPP